MPVSRSPAVILAFAALVASAALAARGGEEAAKPAPAEAIKAPAAEPGAPKPAEGELRILAPKPQTPPAPYGPGPVFVLRIDDESPDGAISEWNLAYIGRWLERARDQKAGLFVIHLTTYGGSLTTVIRMAEKISDAKGLRTACFVDDRAISAGALVALSCDDIYMKPNSNIGAATPIMVSPGGGGPEAVPAKVEEKFIRVTVSKFESIAQKKGHSAALAAAMVDPDLEVLAVRRGSEGPVELMNRQEYEQAAAGPEGRRVQLVEVVNDQKKLLVLTSEQAIKWGFAKGTPADVPELAKLAGLGGRQIVEVRPTLSDILARFFSSGVVVSLLVGAAILALYMELQHPSGVAAGFFLLALGLFFWANYMAGTANALSIILVVLGAVFLAVEIFFFPGFGVPGIIGVVLVALGLITARIPPEFFSLPGGGGGGGGGYDPPAFRWELVGRAAIPVLGGFGLGALGVAILMRFFPQMPFLNRLVLTSDLSGAVVTAAGAAGVERPEQLVGRVGAAHTNLRPGGSARFDGKLLDVISDGEWLEAGARVKIVSADSNRIIVRRA